MPNPVPPLKIVAQSISEGQEVTGLVLWRVELTVPAARHVEFLVDGVAARRRRGGALHARLERGRRAAGAAPPDRPRGGPASGKTVEATVTVTVPPPGPPVPG